MHLIRLSVLLLTSALLLGSTLLVSPTAFAQGTEEDRELAAQLYEKAKEAYKDGEYEQAVKWLEQAYSLDDDPVILYNLGRSYEGLGNLDKAEETLKEVRADPQTPQDILKRINTDLKRLSNLRAGIKQVGQVTINTTPSGARVFIDGKEEGKTPFAASRDVGSYSLLLQLDGYQSIETSFNVEKDETTAVEQQMVSLTAGNGTSNWPTSGLAIASYVSYGLGVVGIATGAGTYFVAKSKHDEYMDESRTEQQRKDAQDQGKTMSTVSVASYAVGFAGLGIGTGLLIWAVLADDGGADTQAADLQPDWAGIDPVDGTIAVGWRW